MKYIKTLLLLLLTTCAPFPEKKCPTKSIKLTEHYDIKACLSSPNVYLEAQENYNDKNYTNIITSLEQSLYDRDMNIPKLENVGVVITDIESYYFESYVFYLPQHYEKAYENIFDDTTGFYVLTNNTIYINITKKNTAMPNRIVLHELLHLVSYKNFREQDHDHSRKILWDEITNEVLEKIN